MAHVVATGVAAASATAAGSLREPERLRKVAGFIGLGNMGMEIALNLSKGTELFVHNRSAEKFTTLSQRVASMRGEGLAGDGTGLGLTWCALPKDVALKASVVFTVLADDGALRDVVFGDDGLLAAAMEAHADGSGRRSSQTTDADPDVGAEGADAVAPFIHVDLSTIGLSTSTELSAAYREAGFTFVHAPVFGRPDAAARSALVVVPSCSVGVLEHLTDFFVLFCNKVIPAGDKAGHSTVLKLLGNFCIASAIETIAEAFLVAEKHRISQDTFLEVVTALMPGPVFSGYARRMVNNNLREPGFTVELGLKDIGHMLAAAASVGATLPVAEVFATNLQEMRENGQAGEDWAYVGEFLRRRHGCPPRDYVLPVSITTPLYAPSDETLPAMDVRRSSTGESTLSQSALDVDKSLLEAAAKAAAAGALKRARDAGDVGERCSGDGGYDLQRHNRSAVAAAVTSRRKRELEHESKKQAAAVTLNAMNSDAQRKV